MTITLSQIILPYHMPPVKYPFVVACFHSPYSGRKYFVRYYVKDYRSVLDADLIDLDNYEYILFDCGYDRPIPLYVMDNLYRAGQMAMERLSDMLRELQSRGNTRI